MVSRVGRGDAEDTGEQDVRELRRRFSEECPEKPINTPFVRDKEDVPHEGSLADFYGLPDDEEEDAVTEVLMDMVDSGELCLGWDAEQGEFIFWHCTPDNASECSPATGPVDVRISPPPAGHRRKAQPRRLVTARRAMTLVAASFCAPFLVGMTAEALEGHQASDTDGGTTRTDSTNDQVQMESSSTPLPPTVSPAAVPATPTTAVRLPAIAPSLGRHVKPRTDPETHRPASVLGRHRRQSSEANQGVKTLIPLTKVTMPPAPSPESEKTDKFLVNAVDNVLEPVGSLLRD